MKNTRALIMLVFAVLLGAMAVALAAQWLGRQGNIATNKVVVAVRDIQLGSPLTPDMLTAVEWPSGSLPTGAISNPVELGDRVVKTTLMRGEPVLESKLAPKGTKGGLSAVIAEGKRAITVKVNEVVGVAGFALPGNHVDIMVNTNDARGRGNDEQHMISKIVLERILVLAVAQEASRDDTKPKVVNAVTLEVTPEEAEKIDLARSVGNLSLVLRNQVDTENAQTNGIRKDELLHGISEPLQVAAARPARTLAKRSSPRAKVVAERDPGQTVEVIKGLNRSDMAF
ncbi:MAG: Flp pilus assembly protein CpaB [Thiobacillus sp.]|uniref:Flp pilus assembly protein CpaB n=1 Tax=Thiobacillus sp. TaxID=924 RepID=UPI002894E0BA|nr:Flp pilus assembly protein CpaB [Thiobacillus sp.]MDT3708248.1 Flp pilus assembly protein CpaB [Thiobacillus sp.]